MTPEPGTVPTPSTWSTWTLRTLIYGGAVAGIGLIVAAVTTDDAPTWWWWTGVPLAVVCGGLVSMWLRFRLRHRSPEERHQALAELAERKATVGAPLERSTFAHRETKHKKHVLRSGIDAEAVVTFLADGKRGTEFEHLVYLELDVTVPGSATYQVRTGEYLTAASTGTVAPGRTLRVKVLPEEPQRVAVDWERSLRLE
ncbi:MAG: hypothetical protein GEU97_20490 [Actinophytocola sp.]|nr:hypothetical protein [Actinophytocola sp.]